MAAKSPITAKTKAFQKIPKILPVYDFANSPPETLTPSKLVKIYARKTSMIKLLNFQEILARNLSTNNDSPVQLVKKFPTHEKFTPIKYQQKSCVQSRYLKFDKVCNSVSPSPKYNKKIEAFSTDSPLSKTKSIESLNSGLPLIMRREKSECNSICPKTARGNEENFIKRRYKSTCGNEELALKLYYKIDKNYIQRREKLMKTILSRKRSVPKINE